MTRIACFTIGILALLVGAASAQPIFLSGSTTVMNMLVTPHEAEIEAASGQHIVVTGNGSQRGLADLITGKAHVAMISAPLALEVGKLNANQRSAIGLARLNAHVVGAARVAFAVHPDNPVRRLSPDQLTDVLAGKTENWREVGGRDERVIIVTAQPGDGLRTMVENTLLAGRKLTSDARAMTNATQIARIVAQVPGALGIVAGASLNSSIAEITQDAALTIPLILVTIGDETPQVRQVIDAVAKLGQF